MCASPIALRVNVCLCMCVFKRVGETETTAAIGTWNLSAHVKTRAKNLNYMHWARFQMHNRLHITTFIIYAKHSLERAELLTQYTKQCGHKSNIRSSNSSKRRATELSQSDE